jgi:Ca2+-transporting ATPase
LINRPPAQSLGAEPVDAKILRAKPRKADDPIVTQTLLLRAITSAALIVFLTLKLFADQTPMHERQESSVEGCR